jgi:Cu/Ag efflux protein CusF
MRTSYVVLAGLSLGLLALLAAPALAADTQGTIDSVNTKNHTFVMKDINGRDWTFKEGENVQIRCNDKTCSLSDLKEGDKVLITYAKSGRDLIASDVKATRTSAAGEAAAANTTTGTIKKIDTDHNQLLVTDKNGTDWTFGMADGAKVQLNNKAGRLHDLKAGETVTIKYEKKGNNFFATDVEAQKK